MGSSSDWTSQYFCVTFESQDQRVEIDLGYPRIYHLQLEEYFLKVQDANAIGNIAYLKIDNIDINIRKTNYKDQSLISIVVPNNSTHVLFPLPFPLIEQPVDTQKFTFTLQNQNGLKLDVEKAYFRFRAFFSRNQMLHGYQLEDFHNTYRQPIRGGW
jgi:hypothetical protein